MKNIKTFKVGAKNRLSLQELTGTEQGYKDFMKHMAESYHPFKEYMNALVDFKWRNHRLPAGAESLGISTSFGEVYISVHMESDNGVGYMLRIDEHGYAKFLTYSKSWENPSADGYTLHLLLSLLSLVSLNGDEDIVNSLERSGLDPDEALECYKELFERVMANLQKATKRLKKTAA